MTESRTRRIFDTALPAVAWSLRALVITTTTLVALGVLNVLVHTYRRVCPLHRSRVEGRAIVPVVYGLALGSDLFERAARSEIVPGGCVRRELDGVCPYCHWPAKFGGGRPTTRRKKERWRSDSLRFEFLQKVADGQRVDAVLGAKGTIALEHDEPTADAFQRGNGLQAFEVVRGQDRKSVV